MRINVATVRITHESEISNLIVECSAIEMAAIANALNHSFEIEEWEYQTIFGIERSEAKEIHRNILAALDLMDPLH